MMQRYSFRVTRGKDIQQEITSDLPDNQAARSEKPLPSFPISHAISRTNIDASPDWQIEVTDEARKPIFRPALAAESLR
jgi:hypothetical protein